MIIKSMTRKDHSFKQLINYLEKDEVINRFSWNLYSNTNNKKEILKEFLENAEHLKKARWNVNMYHEVIALEDNSLSIQRQAEILQELTQEYINKRAKEHLVYYVFHNDTKHLHCHLLISSNKVAENKRERLSKAEFAQIQKELEEYKNLTFKDELEQTYFYTNEKDLEKYKQQEQEIKHRRKKQSKNELVKEQLKQIFTNSFSKTALKNSLENKGFKFYERGLTIGVKFEGKKYRLKTLWLEQEYKRTILKLEKKVLREEKRSEFKNSKLQKRVNTRTHTR